MDHLQDLKKALTDAYAQSSLQKALKTSQSKSLEKLIRNHQQDQRLISTILHMADVTDNYNDPNDIDLALDTINLAKIYEGVDAREKEGTKLAYQDLLVTELLHYFKHDFFTWVTKPKCPQCHNDGDNIEPKGSSTPPTPNPDEISVVENYRCVECGVNVDFPRINKPAKLLVTRLGRCGEWVNCFMLLLRALLGAEGHIRYVWNNEDHVWCEFYSDSQQRWIHLDPCEDVFDDPNLYCQNWGKKMSYCIGFGDSYVVDLSEKYITNKDKQIDKKSVVSDLQLVPQLIKQINARKLLKTYESFRYESTALQRIYDILVMCNNEQMKILTPVASKTEAVGRQSGTAEWTSSRGEGGS